MTEATMADSEVAEEGEEVSRAAEVAVTAAVDSAADAAVTEAAAAVVSVAAVEVAAATVAADSAAVTEAAAAVDSVEGGVVVDAAAVAAAVIAGPMSNRGSNSNEFFVTNVASCVRLASFFHKLRFFSLH